MLEVMAASEIGGARSILPPHRPSARAIGVTISVSLAFVIVPSIPIRAARLWAGEWGTTPTGNKAPVRSSWTGFNQKPCRSLVKYCTKTVRHEGLFRGLRNCTQIKLLKTPRVGFEGAELTRLIV